MNKNSKTAAAPTVGQPVTGFTKEICRALRVEIQEALDKIAAKHGLESIQLGNIGLTSPEFKAPIVAKVKADLNPQKRQQNELYSSFLGYTANIVGLQFTYDGKTFKVLEIDLKKPKYPIVVQNVANNDRHGFPNTMRLPFADKAIEWKAPQSV